MQKGHMEHRHFALVEVHILTSIHKRSVTELSSIYTN